MDNVSLKKMIFHAKIAVTRWYKVEVLPRGCDKKNKANPYKCTTQ